MGKTSQFGFLHRSGVGWSYCIDGGRMILRQSGNEVNVIWIFLPQMSLDPIEALFPLGETLLLQLKFGPLRTEHLFRVGCDVRKARRILFARRAPCRCNAV